MKRQHNFCIALASLAVFLGSVYQAGAQWLTQTVVVTNGWTAVYLFVDASSQNIIPSTARLPLSPGNPIDQIWLWKVPPSTAQYITSPLSPLSSGGAWVSWGLTNAQNSLGALIPNAAYLIHSSGTGTYTWTIQGQPVPPSYTWDLTGLNFIGFSTPSANPPSFQNYFAQDPAVASIVQIYQYVGGEFSTQPPNLNPAPVTSPFFPYTQVKRGQAYWIGSSNVNNTYFGPFQVNLPNPAGLVYGATGGQFTFHLVNATPNPLTISMSVLPSETPPYGQTPIVAPPPLLLEGALNSSNLTYAYTTLGASSGPTSWTLPPYGQPGSDVPVVLGVNRFAMTGTNGALYAGILQFTDSLGFSQLNVPVSATVANNAGLWLGTANVSQVSYDLKTYATNASGSLVSSLSTNQVVVLTTNTAASLGPATNLLIANAATSNQIANYYTVTNEVVNIYTTNANLFSTNGFVISTNLLVSLDFTTNVDVTTTVTGYYFTNNGELLVWETDNSTNTTVVTNLMTTNQVIVTNQIAVVPTNGAPVGITNFEFDNYLIESQLVTNGLFLSPVTNIVFTTNFTLTEPSFSTNAAYDVAATTQVPNVSTIINPPVVTNYASITNVVAALVTTNLFPGPFLSVFTNNTSLISVSVATNSYAVTNLVSLSYTTNYQEISNNYIVNQGATNLVSSATNLVSSFTYAPPVTSSYTNYTNLNLVFATNPLVVASTNMLVSSVSNYVVTAHNTNLDSVVAPYPLRLIVFNDSSTGSCSLLQRVYYGLRQNTNLVVATTQSVLDVSHLAIARRITATHLPWSATNTPWAFSGGPLAQGGIYTTTVTEKYDDQASNPFLHTYHPDHNNLDSQSPPHELPMGSESYEIDRTITLSLVANTNDFISLTTANSVLSGIYNETIALKGLSGYAKTYQTAGTFSLQRISTIPTLTTQ